MSARIPAKSGDTQIFCVLFNPAYGTLAGCPAALYLTIMTPTLRKNLCASALLLAFAAPATYSQTTSTQSSNAANDGADVASVVVIGSRFPSTPDLPPIGAQVITAADIRNAGVDNVNEAIRKLGGVYGRQNFYGTQDYDLDMNGFGSDSDNNLVVVVDGVRISESEQAVAVLSQIPIDSVDRIEIMHGGSSVLYGDGATGGVIQVITKRLGPTPLTGSVTLEAGQFHDYGGRAFLAQGGDNYNVSLNLSDQRSDNYRVNNAVTQKNASGTVTWFGSDFRFGLRVDIAHQDAGFAGALSTLQEFDQNPKQSLTPYDNGSIDINRYTAFIEKTMGSWQAAAELSTRERTAQSDFVSEQSTSTYTGHQTEFTPRLRNITNIDGLHNEFVAGLDLMNWNRQTDSSFSLAYATQQSHALYFRDEVKVGDARFAAGARREIFDKSSSDPIAYSTDNYNVEQGVNAWEMQASYAFLPVVDGFVNVGQSYRVANVDDNAYTATANTPLLPQLSHDLEVGTTLGNANEQLTARLFRHDITDEIYYNPLLNNGYGANANLDPTRREGVALDGKVQLSQQFKLTAQVQHNEATFTAGVNDGKDMVLVPKNTASAHLNWLSGNGQSAYVGGQWVDTQRYGGDFTNSCSAVIPSHATLDGRYAVTVSAWEFALAGSNLTNKQYFTNAYGACMSGIYPDDGRQIKATVRYSF